MAVTLSPGRPSSVVYDSQPSLVNFIEGVDAARIFIHQLLQFNFHGMREDTVLFIMVTIERFIDFFRFFLDFPLADATVALGDVPHQRERGLEEGALHRFHRAAHEALHAMHTVDHVPDQQPGNGAERTRQAEIE